MRREHILSIFLIGVSKHALRFMKDSSIGKIFGSEFAVKCGFPRQEPVRREGTKVGQALWWGFVVGDLVSLASASSRLRASGKVGEELRAKVILSSGPGLAGDTATVGSLLTAATARGDSRKARSEIRWTSSPGRHIACSTMGTPPASNARKDPT